MAGKKTGPTPDDIMSPAELKPLLVRSKHEPVSCAIGLTKDNDGVILLDKRLKPKKLLAELKKQAGKLKLDLNVPLLRFGKAVVDTDEDASLVKFIVNKESPGALRLKLLEHVRKAGFGKVDIQVDDRLEAEPEEDAQGAPPSTTFATPLANPFDAPEAQIEIEKLVLPEIQQLAVDQAFNARNDFETAIHKVKDAKKAAADAEEAKKQLAMSIAITIALMPAGPIMEAASTAIAGPAVQTAIMKAIGNNAGRLEAKFGPMGGDAASKAMEVVTSKAITRMADKFQPAKAKQALEFGVSSLQGQLVKFVASSNKGACVANYLDAMLKSANDAMHNLTNFIRTTATYSEALAYYNYFSRPLQAIYEATLSQQSDDMLSEIADALAAGGGPSSLLIGEQHKIVRLQAYGRPRFAHIKVTSDIKTAITAYYFEKWVTPDMEAMAAKLATEDFDPADFSNRMPDPQREPGERIVLVDGWGRERAMLIDVEDDGIFWKEYGALKFKQWPETDEEEKVFRARGDMQIGGLEKVELKNIKEVKAPAA